MDALRSDPDLQLHSEYPTEAKLCRFLQEKKQRISGKLTV